MFFVSYGIAKCTREIIRGSVNAKVSVLPNVFIVSNGIAKCIRETIRGSVMCCYLTTNELI